MWCSSRLLNRPPPLAVLRDNQAQWVTGGRLQTTHRFCSSVHPASNSSSFYSFHMLVESGADPEKASSPARSGHIPKEMLAINGQWLTLITHITKLFSGNHQEHITLMSSPVTKVVVRWPWRKTHNPPWRMSRMWGRSHRCHVHLFWLNTRCSHLHHDACRLVKIQEGEEWKAWWALFQRSTSLSPIGWDPRFRTPQYQMSFIQACVKTVFDINALMFSQKELLHVIIELQITFSQNKICHTLV